MTAPLNSRNEEIFPIHSQFRPERWIENPRLDRYQLAFSKGTRICLGVSDFVLRPESTWLMSWML
jgi:cytochrome P450